MATMVNCKCANCGAEFQARLADRRRGWGRFCSKSCKAYKQAKSGVRPVGYYSSEKDYIDISDADFGASDGD